MVLLIFFVFIQKTLSAAVKSIEDHGYILDLGVSGVTGFLQFKDFKSGSYESNTKLHVGHLLDATITKVSENGRTFSVSVDPKFFTSSSVSLHIILILLLSSSGHFSYQRSRT